MISYVRQAITTNGGTPLSFRLIDAWRELVTAYGGTPSSYRLTDLMREAITAVGGTPTQRAEIPLLRELLTALGVSPVGYFPRVLYQQLAETPSGPAIVYTPALSPVPEGTAAGTLIGELSMLNPEAGTYTFTEETDTSGKFSNDGTNGKDVRTAGTWDYDVGTGYYEVTYKADNGAGSVVYKTVRVTISNVFEAANLAALGFSGTLTQSASSTITITSATATSTLSLGTGSLPAGMTLNSGPRTITGTPTTLGTGSAEIIETLADSANSPRSNTWNWEVVAAGSGTAGEPIGLLLSLLKAA